MNDGSIGSDLLKTVRRVMAGEYGRGLSVKVFAGQCLSYRLGGAAGDGLIDVHGPPSAALAEPP